MCEERWAAFQAFLDAHRDCTTDDECTVVGSCNLDARSLWINHEFVAVIRSRALARVLGEIVRHEMARSRRITLRESLAAPWWQRLLNRLAWSWRWWL